MGHRLKNCGVPTMKLFTDQQRTQLRKNAAQPDDGRKGKFKPVVKLFAPDAHAVWLLSEMDEDGRCFGLCDLGLGYPELGYIMESELKSFRGRFRLPIERDRHFTADKTITEYADAASSEWRIVA